MEEQPHKLRTFFKILHGLFYVALSVLIVWFLFNKETIPFIQSLSLPKQASIVLQKIQKEINSPGALIAKIESDNAYLTNSGVFTLTNIERTKVGERKLAKNSTLDLIAKKRMNDMFAKGYFEHVSPAGQSASTVAEDVGFEYITIGENIAMGNFADDATLVKAWMDSPGHRANILNTKYTELGVAVGKGIYNGRQTWIGVQIFAKPLSDCPAIDANLKKEVESKTAVIDSLKNQIQVLELEMQQLKSDGKYNEYNAKIDEFNNLAHSINVLVVEVKSQVDEYNAEVRAFNACTEG
jgi:uncharacterized protein YkwD